MKLCDLCKEEVDKLETLSDEYQTREVKEICGACLHIVNTSLWKFNAFWDNIKSVEKIKWYAKFIEKLQSIK